MAIAIKIRRADQAPARRESWAKAAVYENVVIEVPDRCLPGSGFVKHIIRPVVAVKVGDSRQFPISGKARAECRSNDC